MPKGLSTYKPRHKFNAVRVERDGIKFPSKKEGNYYDQLKLAKKVGMVLFWHRQVKFDLPGGVTYAVDFQVFNTDGTVSYIDVKGHRTKEFIRNKKMVEVLYPVKIQEG